MKVLRVWLDGQSGSKKVSHASIIIILDSLLMPNRLSKGTNINSFPSLEPSRICNGDSSCYDDTVLERYDDLMVAAHSYGIKVLSPQENLNILWCH